MSSLENYVVAWLDTLPQTTATTESIGISNPTATTTTTTTTTASKKRKSNDLLSPPPSTKETAASGMATETPRSKRARVDNDNVGEMTPRPGVPVSISGRGAAVPSLTSSRTESHQSGRSSPSIELSKLELESDGIETKALNTLGCTDMPQGLRDLALDMETIGHGVGVIPSSLKERIRDSEAVNTSFLRFVFEEEADPSSDVDVLKSNVLYDAVCDVVSESIDCQEQQQVELGWNNLYDG